MSSLRNDLVMDVAHCNPSPGAEVISYKRKNPPGNNQLWKKEPAGENTFHLVSKLGSNCKVTIKVGTLNLHDCPNPLSNWEIFNYNSASPVV